MTEVLVWILVGIMLVMYIAVSIVVLTERKGIKQQLKEMKEKILGDE